MTRTKTRALSNLANVSISVLDYGAVGDGTTDDTTAIQDAIDAAILITNTLPCTLSFPGGIYKVTAQLNFIAEGGKRLEIVGGGGTMPMAEILCAYHGSGSFLSGDPKAAFYFANKTGAPDGYMRAVGVAGFLFKRFSSSFGAPVGIHAHGWAQSRMSDVTFGSWDNTCIRLVSPQNVKLEEVVLFAGGDSYSSYSNTNITATQSGTTLTASTTGVFDVDDVGRTITLVGTGGSTHKRKVEITSITSSAVAEVTPSYTDANAREIRRGSGYAALTINGFNVAVNPYGSTNPVTEAAKGKSIWFKPTTGSDTSLHRGVVVSRSGGTVTLNTQAPFSSSKCTYATPAFEVYKDDNIYGKISDVKFINCQFENCRGVNLCAKDVSVFEMTNIKLHSEQTITPTDYTEAALWLDQADGSFVGSLDGQTLGDFKVFTTSQTSTFSFLALHARSAWFEKVFGIGYRNSLFDGSSVSIGDVSLSSTHPTLTTFNNIIKDYNFGTRAGYVHCGTFSSQGTSQGGQIGTALGPNVFLEDLDSPSNPELTFGRVSILTSTDNPEGLINANPGSLCLRFASTGAGNLYIKKSGTGNTGWEVVTTS